MQNLDQIRAAHAFNNVGNLHKSAISKLPALILNNGLLAAAAFTLDGGGENRADMKRAFEIATKFLAQRGLVKASLNNPRDLVHHLSNGTALDLQRITMETLAYLAYLKRFATKQRDED